MARHLDRRAGRDRTLAFPEMNRPESLSWATTTGLTVGDRVVGLTDGARRLAGHYTAVEAPTSPRSRRTSSTASPQTADLGADRVDATVPSMPGSPPARPSWSTAPPAVWSIAIELAREVGAQVIGTGRTDDARVALGLGAQAFLNLDTILLEDVGGGVDVVFDVIGGDVLERAQPHWRAGGTLATIAMPPTVQPKEGRAVFFVVEPYRAAGRPGPAIAGRAAQARPPAAPSKRRPTRSPATDGSR